MSNPKKSINAFSDTEQSLKKVPEHAFHLLVLNLELLIFKNRFDHIAKMPDDSVQIRFDKASLRAIKLISTCSSRIELQVRTLFPKAYNKLGIKALSSSLLNVNCGLLYGDIETLESDIKRISKTKAAQVREPLTEIKNFFNNQTLWHQYFCFLIEQKVIRGRKSWLDHSPLIKRDLKRAFNTLEEALDIIETGTNRVLESWKHKRIDDQLDELSFCSMELNQTLLKKNEVERSLIINEVFKVMTSDEVPTAPEVEKMVIESSYS